MQKSRSRRQWPGWTGPVVAFILVALAAIFLIVVRPFALGSAPATVPQQPVPAQSGLADAIGKMAASDDVVIEENPDREGASRNGPRAMIRTVAQASIVGERYTVPNPGPILVFSDKNMAAVGGGIDPNTPVTVIRYETGAEVFGSNQWALVPWTDYYGRPGGQGWILALMLTETLPPPPSAIPAYLQDSFALLRACESGGNYQINTGNGFYGAYQFLPSTWKGLGFGGVPHLADPRTQDEAAYKLYLRSGKGQWPVCGTHLP